MHIQIANKGIDVSDSLRAKILDRVEDGVSKYFSRPGEAYVSIAREGDGFRIDCSLHLPSGMMLQAHDSADDAYKAADGTVIKLEKRLRRYKRKLKNHRQGQRSELPAESLPIFVLKGMRDTYSEEDEDQVDEIQSDVPEPIVIAEHPGEVRTLTVGMASLELDAADSPFLMFRNAANGGLNIVYRRPDGHIGWLDPSRVAST